MFWVKYIFKKFHYVGTLDLPLLVNVGGNDTRAALTLTEILENVLLSPVETMEWVDSNQILVKAVDCIKIVNTSSLPATCNYYDKDNILVSKNAIFK